MAPPKSKPHAALRPRFWEAVALSEMTPPEWEALCDGCAKCCLLKLEDEDTGDVFYTDIACRLLDAGACRCTDYARRTERVPGCVSLSPETLPKIAPWLPATCAYRVLQEGGRLAWWHPLISGDPESVHAAGVSARGRTVPEESVPESTVEERVIETGWINANPEPDERSTEDSSPPTEKNAKKR